MILVNTSAVKNVLRLLFILVRVRKPVLVFAVFVNALDVSVLALHVAD